MYTGTLEPRSNRADWVQTVEVTDESGNAVDLTSASIKVAIADPEQCSVVAEATTNNGKVTVPSVGVFQWVFAVNDMRALEPGDYVIGVTITINGQTDQLLVGDVAIVDGVVS